MDKRNHHSVIWKTSKMATKAPALGYIRPETYEELRAVLSSGTIHLPKRLQQVAVYFWQHPNEVALGTITSISGEVGVRPSTLVRFAQALGFSGFSEFQLLFKAHIISGLSASNDDGPQNDHIVGSFVDAAQQSLTRLGKDIDEAKFAAIIDGLAAANIIYLVGSKRAYPVVTYLSVALSQQGVRNILVGNTGSLGFDELGCIEKNDAVLAINFSPYNSITPELVRAAQQHGTPAYAITDSAFSPLVELASHYLEVVEAEYSGFRTLSATMTLVTALAVALGRKRDS
jgi:DNA-binding MurR/RpiR family transcriptional regulator